MSPVPIIDLYFDYNQIQKNYKQNNPTTRTTERIFKELSTRWVHSVLSNEREINSSDAAAKLMKEEYCIGSNNYCKKVADLLDEKGKPNTGKNSQIYNDIRKSVTEFKTNYCNSNDSKECNDIEKLTDIIVEEIREVAHAICLDGNKNKDAKITSMLVLRKYLSSLKFLDIDLALTGRQQYSSDTPESERPIPNMDQSKQVLNLRTCPKDSESADFSIILEDLYTAVKNRFNEIKGSSVLSENARELSEEFGRMMALYQKNENEQMLKNARSGLRRVSPKAHSGGRTRRRNNTGKRTNRRIRRKSKSNKRRNRTKNRNRAGSRRRRNNRR